MWRYAHSILTEKILSPIVDSTHNFPYNNVCSFVNPYYMRDKYHRVIVVPSCLTVYLHNPFLLAVPMYLPMPYFAMMCLLHINLPKIAISIVLHLLCRHTASPCCSTELVSLTGPKPVSLSLQFHVAECPASYVQQDNG